MRLFRRKETAGESEETRVRSCLLEYGESFATNKRYYETIFQIFICLLLYYI